MTAEKLIVHESDHHWIRSVTKGKGSNYSGFEVYHIGITHSTRCAQIGFTSKIGLDKAIKEVAKRESAM